jgi:hypothetical protein
MLSSGGDGKGLEREGREREGRDRKGPGMAVTGTAARRNGVSRSQGADVVSSECAKAWLLTGRARTAGGVSAE